MRSLLYKKAVIDHGFGGSASIDGLDKEQLDTYETQ